VYDLGNHCSSSSSIVGRRSISGGATSGSCIFIAEALVVALVALGKENIREIRMGEDRIRKASHTTASSQHRDGEQQTPCEISAIITARVGIPDEANAPRS
jgi:glutamine phosphoribosylpyrophosphate amidotransferase